MKNISRRNFIKGAAVSALTFALTGKDIVSANAEETERPSWCPEKWDYEADIVVCGFGGGGAMAMRSAIENGCSCLALESAPVEYAGGSTACCAGVCSATTDIDRFIYSSMGYLTPEAAQRIADEEVKVVTWLTANGLQFNGALAVGFGHGLYESEKQAVLSCGANVLYETKVKHLVFDPVTKEVFGVQAETKDGPVYVKANKGVVLATGNFAGNPDLMHTYMLPREIEFAQNGSPYDDGAAIEMGQEIGAGMLNMNIFTLELTDMDLKKASEGIGVGVDICPRGDYAWSLMYVNQKGQRFMNEDQVLDHFKGNLPWLEFGGTAAAGYTGWTNLPCYLIVDSKLADSSPLNTVSQYGMAYAGAFGLYHWSNDNQAEVEKGWIVKADTIEELCEKLAESSGHDPIDPEALKATIEEYNQLCNAGEKDRFGRTSWSTIDTAPYYACELETGCVYTMGGLKPGMNFETLECHDNPIPRLYHCGDVGQHNAIISMGTCGAMAGGSIAARELSRMESRSIPGEVGTVIAPPTSEEMAAAAFIEREDGLAEPGEWIDGVYTAQAEGMNGTFDVNVTIEGGYISAVDFGPNNETEGLGAAALEQIPNIVISNQSYTFDAISGASTTSAGVSAAIRKCLQQASGAPTELSLEEIGFIN